MWPILYFAYLAPVTPSLRLQFTGCISFSVCVCALSPDHSISAAIAIGRRTLNVLPGYLIVMFSYIFVDIFALL